MDNAIHAIIASYDKLGGVNPAQGDTIPSRKGVRILIIQLKEILFPGYFEPIRITPQNRQAVITQKVTDWANALTCELSKSFRWQGGNSTEKASAITHKFLDYIPTLRAQLQEDAAAHYEGDPAAQSEDEIILAYPGFLGITVHRIAHFFYQHKVPLIPRLMSEIVHGETGIDIHPGATIGPRFCIDHGTGIVIGETAVIGKNVKLYQGVTLGALSVPNKNVQGKRHPTLEDTVTVYSGTTILGGNTVIGKNSIIGGNVWITSSIPPHSKVYLSADQHQVFKTDSIQSGAFDGSGI